MKFGQVIGKVVLQVAVPEYIGGRLLLVHPLSKNQLAGAPLKPLDKADTLVLWDELGAGDGDVIGYSESGEAAAAFPVPTPVDAYNCGIINQFSYTPPA